MALHAAQQDNVFKTRIADRIVTVFHSWPQMFLFSAEGSGIHSFGCFKPDFWDRLTVLFDPFIFSGVTALTTRRDQPREAQAV